MMFYNVHTASCQKPMALAESTVNPWTSSQEDAMHNSLLAVLSRELQASFCSAYNGKAMAFLMNSLAELYPAISNIGGCC